MLQVDTTRGYGVKAVRRDGRILHAHHRPAAPGQATLAFSNSLGTDLRIWDRVVAALPDTLGLLRYDTAGHGLSPSGGEMSIEDHGADLVALLDAFGIDRAAIVGLSVGGQIAQAVALSAPERVAGLLLSNTAPKIGTAEAWGARFAAIGTGGMEAIADATMERWFSESFRTANPDELLLWRTMLTHTPARNYIDLGRAIVGCDFTDRVATIAAPTLCLAGGEDLATPPAVVKAMAEAIPGAQYREIAGVGHLPCIEAAEETILAIADLLKEVGR